MVRFGNKVSLMASAFVEMDRGSNLEPRDTEEDAYPMYLPQHLVFSLFIAKGKV